MKRLLVGSTVALALTVLTEAKPSNAALTYFIYESMGNLVVETSGSLALPTTSPGNAACGGNGAFFSSLAAICTGNDAVGPFYGITGTTVFPGSASLGSASTVSGIATNLNGSSNFFQVGPGYVSGSPLISSATFNGRTLASLGLPPSGTLGSWTINGTADTITAKIAVPGPVPLLGAGAAFGFSRRLRQRIQSRQVKSES
ncbi:MAG: hypothetical protein FJ083_13575 [Cyanobacteria bacterium K_Offshore_surface_m2_239]|nr:hypothetical protein [Cyanobacteria bacterium K_Offshore_surface_m2_239]